MYTHSSPRQAREASAAQTGPGRSLCRWWCGCPARLKLKRAIISPAAQQILKTGEQGQTHRLRLHDRVEGRVGLPRTNQGGARVSKDTNGPPLSATGISPRPPPKVELVLPRQGLARARSTEHSPRGGRRAAWAGRRPRRCSTACSAGTRPTAASSTPPAHTRTASGKSPALADYKVAIRPAAQTRSRIGALDYVLSVK
jgi:hypothetical protein